MSKEDHIFFWYSSTFFCIGLTRRKGDFRIPDREGKHRYFPKGGRKNTRYLATKNIYLRFGRL